jgi:hypothetical protein
MADAPFISTFVALALIPVAFLFTHAYVSGRKHLAYHTLTGTIGIVWDLSLSIFYMLFRLFGGQVEGSSLEVEDALIAYFAIHGIIAIVVIGLEISMLATGIVQMRRKKEIGLHRKLSTSLYILWFVAFASGEAVYIAYYILG